MIPVEFCGKSVLITGGTRGLGEAIGRSFSRAGATVFLTHRWGSIDEAALQTSFADAGLARPFVVESDASDTEAVYRLIRTIAAETGRLDVLVSNVAFAKRISTLADLKRNALDLSLHYSAWPLVDLVQACRAEFGRFPRYILGISSDGGEVCHPYYDLAGTAKAALETLCRYLAVRLQGDGVRVNAIRPGFLDTASSRATFGDAVVDKMKARVPNLFLDPELVAQSCVALCSGLMDGVNGQVIVVDGGASLASPVARLIEAEPVEAGGSYGETT